MSTALYPMKFMPLFKNKVWGGNKIKSYGFDYSPLPNCGELWVLSGVEDNESVVENGFLKGNHINEVLEVYMGEVLGEENYDRFGSEFPLLLKLIDANDKLSIQVHPDDALAQKRGMENGKTEMWYILEAGEGAEIVDGFEQQVTPEEYRQYLEAGLIERLLHVEHPQRGDMFFIPAGRIHANGVVGRMPLFYYQPDFAHTADGQGLYGTRLVCAVFLCGGDCRGEEYGACGADACRGVCAGACCRGQGGIVCQRAGQVARGIYRPCPMERRKRPPHSCRGLVGRV